MENAPELDTAHRIWCTRSAVGSCRRPSHYQPKSPPEDTRACTNTNTSTYTCTHISYIYINASICKYAGTRTHTYAYECANVSIYPYIHTQKKKKTWPPFALMRTIGACVRSNSSTLQGGLMHTALWRKFSNVNSTVISQSRFGS